MPQVKCFARGVNKNVREVTRRWPAEKVPISPSGAARSRARRRRPAAAVPARRPSRCRSAGAGRWPARSGSAASSSSARSRPSPTTMSPLAADAAAEEAQLRGVGVALGVAAGRRALRPPRRRASRVPLSRLASRPAAPAVGAPLEGGVSHAGTRRLPAPLQRSRHARALPPPRTRREGTAAAGRTRWSGHRARDRLLASTKDRSPLTSKTRDAFPCGLIAVIRVIDCCTVWHKYPLSCNARAPRSLIARAPDVRPASGIIGRCAPRVSSASHAGSRITSTARDASNAIASTGRRPRWSRRPGAPGE